MIAILLISHGVLAKGMVETVQVFFGDDIPAFDFLLLQSQEDPEDFRNALLKKIKQIDQQEGVVILADLFGGTPCNQTAFILNETISVLSGMNLAMVMEALAMRSSGTICLQQLEEAAKQGIINFNECIANKKEQMKKTKEIQV